MSRLLIISSNVFPIPLKNYGGVEELCYQMSEGLAKKGYTVSIVCPEGSTLSENIECIFTQLREPEEQSWARYRGRLESGEWQCVIDASWEKWSEMSNAGRDPAIPILLWHHSDPSIYNMPVPVRHPMWVGLSRDHARRLSLHMRAPVRYIWNGIDTQFYMPTGAPRSERYLWIGRYSAEKNPMGLIDMAQKMKVGVDFYGDTEIVGGEEYVRSCFNRADGYFARVNKGITREATVDAYSKAKGMLFFPLWEEPFGLTVLESMACGCVPICRKSGAIPELIKHGETGFLVDDIGEMEDLIKREAIKEINPDTMRKHVQDNFSIEKFLERWDNLIQRVVAGERW